MEASARSRGQEQPCSVVDVGVDGGRWWLSNQDCDGHAMHLAGCVH